MKKEISLLLALIPLCLTAQEKTFTVQGKIGKLNPPATAIVSYNLNGKTYADTSLIRNGVFTLKGKLNTPLAGNITVYPQGMVPLSHDKPIPGAAMRIIWLEPGTIKVEDTASLFTASFISKTNDEQQAYYDAREAVSKAGGNMSDMQKKFIQSHPSSAVSLRILYEEGASMSGILSGIPDINLVKPLFNNLSPAVKKSSMGRFYQSQLKVWEMANVGSMAPDFTQPDKNGKAIQLSDYKGKYVLVDFWASWCVPCRAENPNLRKQYDLFKDKGFTILSISLDGDNHGTRESWLKAIEKDSIGAWSHVCDFVGYDKNAVRVKYGVNGVPENFLVDPTGKIIGKSLRGEQLGKKLSEVFTESSPSVATIPVTTAVANAADELLTRKIALDTAVRYGKLKNGFTYYIRKNAQPKDRVIFYLANKAGSILEEDNQRGLAHFMEHMNFNGTTHFPKNELVDYLQKAGVQFGADINAYTSFDETVFQLPLPADKPDVLQNALLIMKDWAQGATLDKVEINKERGVVLEEKRKGQGAGERMQRQYLPVLLNQSRYAERLPIGTEEVLKNFRPETLHAFYTNWYRPNLQALIIVGDIDVDAMEKAVADNFSGLKNPVNEPERIVYTVPLTGKNQFIIASDAEVSDINVEVIYKHRAGTIQTGEGYRNQMLQSLFNSMMADRVNELTSNKSNPPFIAGSAGIHSFIGRLDNYSLSLRAKPGEIENGFKALWKENERLRRHGFTQTELDRARKAFLNRLEGQVAELATRNSQLYVSEYLAHFLKETAAPGIATEYQLAKDLAPGITLTDFAFLIKDYIKEADRDILITAPEKERYLLPDESKVSQWMNEIQNSIIAPYTDSYKETPLFNKTVTPGKIIKSRALNNIAATEWTLSNGAKVIIKPTDFMANDISFLAVAPGGSSLYSDEDYPSATYATMLLNMSGIGEMNASEMNKFFSNRQMLVGLMMEVYESKLIGGTSVKELETFLQTVHLRFGKQKLDRESFKGTISNFLAALSNKGKNPEDEFYRLIDKTITNGNIRGKAEDSAFYQSINLDRAYQIYNEVFGNASGFTFLFVGQADTVILKPLVEKYIASLPGNHQKSAPQNVKLYPPAGKITKVLYKGMEQKAMVNLTFSGLYTYGEAENKTLDALKEILQIQLLERLREKESGVYTPSVSVTKENVPEQRYRFRISFECSPDNVDKLIASALDEVNKLKTAGPREVDIEKFKAEDRNSHETMLKENYYWVEYIRELVLNNKDVNEPVNYDAVMKKVSKESIREAAGKYLSGDNLIRFILMPEKYKGRNL